MGTAAIIGKKGTVVDLPIVGIWEQRLLLG